MRKFTILFSILFIFIISDNTKGQSGWVQQNSGTTTNLYSIFFVNSETGYCTGYLQSTSGSIILKTTNGGLNWITIKSLALTSLWAIFFIDSNTGYIVGDSYNGGTILKTNDGGSNWNINIVQTSMLYSPYFFNNDSGFIGGKYGNMLTTTNGGTNWNMSNPTYYDIQSIYFPNSETGFFACGGGGPDPKHIYKTTNRGLNWLDVSPVYSYYFMSVYFTSVNTGYACGYYGIVKTTNSGANWIAVLPNPIGWLYGSFFTSDFTGYIVGSRQILKTTNGGTNFINQIPNQYQNQDILSVYFINSNTGFVCGSFGIILKTTTGGEPIGIKPISSEVPKTFSLSQNYPNPFNPTTKIKFDVPTSPVPSKGGGQVVSLKVFDILGREVATLLNESATGGLKPGTYEVEWDATSYPSGVYFYKLTATEFTETKRMVLVK